MAGRLRHRLTVQQQGTSQDSVGQQVQTWTDVGTYWGSVDPVSARDYFNASGEHAEITHKVLMRDELTLRPGDRIVYNSRQFDVRQVMKIGERDRWLNIMAVENAG